MENEGAVDAGTQDVGSASNGAVDSQVTEDQSGGVPEANANGQPEGDTNPDGGKHEESVPYARFKEVNDKLSEFTSLIESAKTDPNAREQLAQMFGVEAKQPPQAAQASVSPFYEFLQKSVAPEMHQHYEGMAKAIASEWEAHLEQKLSPFMAFMGRTSLDSAYSKNPLLKEHQAELSEVMKKHPTLSAEEAGWHIPTLREKMIKQASMSGQKKEAQRIQSLRQTPVTRTQGAPGGTPAPSPRTPREMLTRTFDRMVQPA